MATPQAARPLSVDEELERMVGAERLRQIKAALLHELRGGFGGTISVELEQARDGTVHGAHVGRRRRVA